MGSLLVMQNNERQAKDNATLDNKVYYNRCMQDSYNSYLADWNKKCESFGIDTKGTNCKLASDRADDLNKRRKDSEDACLKIYEANS